MKKDSKGERSSGTQLLDRSVSILNYLSRAGKKGAKLTELIDALGLTMSTGHRIISGLERHGLIVRDKSTKIYRLGLSLFVLGAQAADGAGLREYGHPSVLNVAAKTGDTAVLMARNGLNAVCIDRQEGGYVVGSLIKRVGEQLPIGVGPASQTMLAFLDAATVDVILEANDALYDQYNGLSSAEIKERLEEIKVHGHAKEDERLAEGIASIAVPILPAGCDVAGALAINMISSKFKKSDIDGLVELLKSEAGKIAQQVSPLDIVV